MRSYTENGDSPIFPDPFLNGAGQKEVRVAIIKNSSKFSVNPITRFHSGFAKAQQEIALANEPGSAVLKRRRTALAFGWTPDCQFVLPHWDRRIMRDRGSSFENEKPVRIRSHPLTPASTCIFTRRVSCPHYVPSSAYSLPQVQPSAQRYRSSGSITAHLG